MQKLAARPNRVLPTSPMAAKTSTKSTTKRNTKRPPANAVETSESVSIETTSVDVRSPAHDEIARRAYELFLSRGRQHGRAQEDWLNAERELRARYSVS
jgi:hypothetical protein